MYYINKNFIPETNPLFVNLLRLHKKNLHLQIGQKDVNFNSDNFLVFREINMQTKIKRKISISVH